MPSLWRHIKLVAFRLGLLGTLVLSVAPAALAYVEIKSNEEVDLPEPTGPYAVGRTFYDWIDRSHEEVSPTRRTTGGS